MEYIDKHPNQNIMKKIFGDFEDKDIYEFIKSYSPYHLMNMLVTAENSQQKFVKTRKTQKYFTRSIAAKNLKKKNFSLELLFSQKSHSMNASF